MCPFHDAVLVAYIFGGILFYWVLKHLIRGKSDIQHLPKPPAASLLWGHEKAVYMNEPGQAFRKWTQALGLTYRIKAALRARDVLVISDPRGIAYILQRKVYDYHHSEVVRPRIARLLGKGLGWVEGEAEHKRMKHLVSPSLSHENVKAPAPFEYQADRCQVIDELTSHIQTQTNDLPINMVDWMARATLNVIGRVAFLYDFEAGNSTEAQRIIHSRRTGASSALSAAAFFTLMLLRRFPVLNALPIKAIQSQGLAKIAVQQTGVARELVRRNQSHVSETEAVPRKDLLTRLLVAHSSGQLSRDELYEQISTFIISGHETTTQTLAFTIYELSRHPDVQRRLREELAQYASEPTYDDFASGMPYLEAVLRETLRLYPALPYMERVATKADTIPLGRPVKLTDNETLSQLRISPGQVVLIPIIAIHRMDSIWKDPDVFRPERWLEPLPPSEDLCNGWANLLAFSDGPRKCIGLRLATFQYKVILSYMVKRFAFSDANMDIKLKIASSLQAWVVGREDLGPCLPAHVELL
ncbi:cytochrome P450 [Polyporus arcularius HHB13444]|uniref:Cytochrome P450 n=1 Tax=Polyporus arcularius HHB13444 TaxID=1314778 RepID=A0A5C3NQ66_9APHY|nr:cytochrome P450 [Polyporus arcularius HHB13444]